MAIQIDLPFDDANDPIDDSALDNPLSNSPLQGRPIRFGSRTIDFASEMEKALYVLASKPRGTFAREQEFIQYLSQFGLSKTQISNFGRSVVSEVKRVSKSSGRTIDISSFTTREKMAEVMRQSSLGYLFLSEEEQAERQRRIEAREKLKKELQSFGEQSSSQLGPLYPKPKYAIEGGKVVGGLPLEPDLFDQYQPTPPTSGGSGAGVGGPIDFIVDPEDAEGPAVNRSHIRQRANSLKAQALASLRNELSKDLQASRARATEISAQASKARAAGYSVGGLFGLPGYAFSTVVDSATIRPEEERLRGLEASYQGSRKDEFADQAFKVQEFFRQYIFEAVDRADDEMLQGVEDALQSLEGKDRGDIFKGISELARGLVDKGLLDDRVKEAGTHDTVGLDPADFKKSAVPPVGGGGAGSGIGGLGGSGASPFGPAGNLAKYTGAAIGAYALLKGAQFVAGIPASIISNVGTNLNASNTVQGQQALLRNASKLNPITALGVNTTANTMLAIFDVVSQVEINTRKDAPFSTPQTLMQDAMNQMLMIQRMMVEGGERDPILAELSKTRAFLSREAEGLKTELLKTFGPILNELLTGLGVSLKVIAEVISSPYGKAVLRYLAGGGGFSGFFFTSLGAWSDAQNLKNALQTNTDLAKDLDDFLSDNYLSSPDRPDSTLNIKMNQGGRF